MKHWLGLAVLLVMLLAQPARADELRPGYLELKETAANTYSLLFKIPARGEDLRLAIYLDLPNGTRDVGASRASLDEGAYVERRTIRRDGGLAGQAIAIAGLSATSTDVLVRVEVLPALSRPSGCHPPGRHLSFRPRPAREKSLRPICALASSTSCSVSIICCSCWRW